MQLGLILVTAVRHLRQFPLLWGLGLLYALPRFLLEQLLPHTPEPTAENLRQWLEPSFWLVPLEALLAWASDWVQVTGWLVGFTAVLLLIWLITTLSEAGLILIVGRAEQGQPPLNLPDLFRATWGLLIRFVAIDTIIFFPLFLLVIMAEFAILGAMAGLLYNLLSTPSAAVSLNAPALFLPLAFAILCFVTLLCAALPLTLLTLLWRLLAFRVAAIADLRTKPSIGLAWRMLKGEWLNLLLVGGVLLLGQMVVGGVMAWVGWPWLTLLVTAVLTTFISTVWTVTYTHLAPNRSS
jgi:hypothetical protein